MLANCFLYFFWRWTMGGHIGIFELTLTIAALTLILGILALLIRFNAARAAKNKKTPSK